jgi:hypothetical protein
MLKIPSKIRVGYNNREDTYTKKLAYVIYYDNKGKLRKEASWQSWRNKKIEPEDFENVPTSGFVLNKKVGDYKSDWNHRMAHIRVYDPRGFEFEISVENLLFILEENSSIKGKGLEGEFVYAWEDKELILLPCCSEDYKSSVKYTAGLNSKITKADMKEGCIYTLKANMSKVMYIGKHKWFDVSASVSENTLYRYADKGEKHIFMQVNNSYRDTYFSEVGFTNLSSRVSEEPSPDFANSFEKFKNSLEGGGLKEVVVSEDTDIHAHLEKNIRYQYSKFLINHNNEYYIVNFEGDYYHYQGWGVTSPAAKFEIIGNKKVVIEGNSVKYTNMKNVTLKTVTFAEIKLMKFYKLVGKTKKGINLTIYT